MFNLLLTLLKNAFFLRYLTLLKILNLSTNLSSNFLTLQETEYITLCNMLLKYKTCYATHKNDVGKISTPFRIRLKPKAQLMTQRPSKVPIHYRDKLNVLLKEVEKYNIIKQIGSSLQDKPVYGTTYLNPPIIIPKGDTIKCVLDARHLNSNTEQSDESWPIEPLAPQLARANKKYKSAIYLMYAYAHAPLDEDTIKLTSFSLEINSSLSSEAFMVSKDFQTSLQNKCLPSLKLLKNKVFPLPTLTMFYFYLTPKNTCSNS